MRCSSFDYLLFQTMSELVLSSLYLDIRAVLSGDAVKKSENDECNDKAETLKPLWVKKTSDLTG